ncbi:uncharacterized protein LOC111088085 [Limulus polyphemus]|uniref:Uncharacterized protein LOC111088085 n=1 Tax=Limulus polyphemus TaxID=6850 RepID=A0ABM1TA10_LIMPO|nr:uncharacterized protein LOC111088085 [Limulus polyphemus]
MNSMEVIFLLFLLGPLFSVNGSVYDDYDSRLKKLYNYPMVTGLTPELIGENPNRIYIRPKDAFHPQYFAIKRMEDKSLDESSPPGFLGARGRRGYQLPLDRKNIPTEFAVSRWRRNDDVFFNLERGNAPAENAAYGYTFLHSNGHKKSSPVSPDYLERFLGVRG